MNYAYDFNYSIQLENMPKPPTPDHSKQLFTQVACALSQASLFANRQLQHFVQLLTKQPLFIKIGTFTCELTEIQLSFIPKSLEISDRLDCLREQLCQCTQELNIILGRQRDYYLNIAILALTLIQVKVILQKYDRKVERSELFHMLHWEIKGYHSTNSALESIESESLSRSRLLGFLENKKEETQKSQVNTSISFGDIGRSINSQRQKNSRFELAINKQNHNSNILRDNVMSFKKEKGRKF